jgi:hypothetical protein
MSHKKYRTETNCLNCGAEVTGKFCSNCGQENIEIRENFFHLALHFVSDYFHFDSKFFRSLIPLFIRPGFLTKQYWEGKRTNYIHPLRLFFFVTILFAVSTTYFYHRFGDRFKEEFKQDVDMIKLDSTYLASLNDTTKLYLPLRKDTLTVKRIKEEKVRDKRQMRKLSAGLDLVFLNLKYVTFFLLPLYAIIFKLLFIRRRSFYVDHLVYMLHVQTFAYCLFCAAFLISILAPDSFPIVRQASVIVLFIYIGLSLRYLYVQPWWKIILKALLTTFALVFLTVFVIFLLAAFDAIFIQ